MLGNIVILSSKRRRRYEYVIQYANQKMRHHQIGQVLWRKPGKEVPHPPQTYAEGQTAWL